MNDCQSTCLGRRSLPRDLSDFESEAFFTFSEAERRVVEERRSPVLKLALALQIRFLRMGGRLLGAVRIVPPPLWRYLGEPLVSRRRIWPPCARCITVGARSLSTSSSCRHCASMRRSLPLRSSPPSSLSSCRHGIGRSCNPMPAALVLRELMPQDLKLDIDSLSREEAVNSARYLAEVVGKAHARQMDAPTRREFSATFKVRRSAKLDAPSWLWTSVVELAATHEAAYLEHCRRYALA